MHFIILDRQQLLNFLDGSAPVHFRSAKEFELKTIIFNLSPEDICLVWSTYSPSARPIWFVQDSMHQETIAFASTYIRNLKPFSAFMRILPASAVEFDWFESGQYGTKDSLHNFVSLAIAEAFLQIPQELNSIDEITIQAGLATLSATIINAIHIGYTRDEIELIFERWKKTKSFFNQEPTPLTSQTIWTVWENILIISSRRSTSANYRPRSYSKSALPARILTTLENIQDEGEISYISWLDLASSVQELGAEYENISGVREDGVRSLQKITSILHSSNANDFSDTEKAIILGAALFIVSSGSLKFLPFSKVFFQLSPTAPLWYAYFCSVSKRSDAMLVGNGLGSHLDRLIFKSGSIFETPQSDISFEEVGMMASPENLVKFRTSNSSNIDVELFPFVRGRFRINRPARSTEKSTPTLSREDSLMLETLLSKALNVIRDSRFTTEKKSSYNESRDLFTGSSTAQARPKVRKKTNDKF